MAQMDRNLGAEHRKDCKPQGIQDEEEVAEIVHEEGHAHRHHGRHDDDHQINGVLYPGKWRVIEDHIANRAAAQRRHGGNHGDTKKVKLLASSG